MVKQISLNSELSWIALLTVEKTFLTVKIPDEEEFVGPVTLRRCRSEPGFTKFWRNDQANGRPLIGNDHLEDKKIYDDGASSTTDIEGSPSCVSGDAAITTREPDSESERFELMSDQSDQSVNFDEEKVKATSWADMSVEPQSHEPTESRNKRKKVDKRVRLCKSKRKRCRNLLNQLKEKVETSPETFSMDHVDLRPSLFFNDALKGKLEAQLQFHQSQVLRVRALQAKQEF